MTGTGNIVSCTKVPGKEKDYVCFTDDYRVVHLDRFFRSKTPPPRPPRKICRMPDIFADLGTPTDFAEAVGVPCRLTVPCVVYIYDGGREKAFSRVNDEVCRKYMEGYPLPQEAYAASTLEVLEDLMDLAKHHSKFGKNVYRSCVFIGKTRAYVAPWTATKLIYDTMKALIDLGFLDKGFEAEVVSRYGALLITSVIGSEKFGRIYRVGFNFYEHNNRLEAVAMFWVRTDRVARRYALRLWDMHINYTTKVIEVVNKLPEDVRLLVEHYRNAKVLGAPHWKTFFPGGGYKAEEVAEHIKNILVAPQVAADVHGVGDPSERFHMVMKSIIKEVFGIDLDEEQAE